MRFLFGKLHINFLSYFPGYSNRSYYQERELQTHSQLYTSVDTKKKTEAMKIHECTNDYPQQVCATDNPDSDGGTPPPVPPHTPEMLFNDGDLIARCM